MATPFDPLAERVMRKVPCPDQGEDVATNRQGIHTEFGYRRFQDKPHEACHGTGTVLDPRWTALREALWEECPCGCHGWIGQKESPPVDPRCLESKCPGFVRRSRAEAAYNLWAAAKPIMRAGPEDALSAALLAWMDTQEAKA